MGPKYKKPKALKKHTAKELALKNARSLAKMKGQVDTKWYDKNIQITSATLVCLPETTTASSSLLNGILPLGNRAPGADATFINTSNRRVGSKVYISGVYLKCQAFWDQPDEPSSEERYPPYCHINWAVVRQKNAVAGVEADAGATQAPQPLDVWQNPAQTDSVLTDDPDTALVGGNQPLGNLPFQNMNNSKNYHILKRGRIYLGGPGNVNIAPAETPADDQITTFTPASLENQECRAFSTSLVKTFDVNMHPKCITQFFQMDEAGNDASTTAVDLTTPVKNGIYFMYWTDVGGASSRFRPPAGSGYTYTLPKMSVNVRVRFRDL